MSTEIELRTVTKDGKFIFWLRGDAKELRDQVRIHWDLLNSLCEIDETEAQQLEMAARPEGE
jgi:predicted transposase YbfD/YdcC